MKIFIDTNVLLDLLLHREDWEQAARIMSLCDLSSYFVLSVSVLTMANVAYIARHRFHGMALYDCLEKVTESLKVEPMDGETLKHAISLRANDFGDALQYVCALESKCELIVTRNKKDFRFSKLRVLSPDELIKELNISVYNIEN
jgi:predicted nucleic acid-binding protein